MKTRVVLVDDHVSVRQMLAATLAREGPYEVVGEAATGYEALKICRQLRPRLVILDLVLPELNGVEVLRQLRAEMRETRLLVYAGTQHRELMLGALREQPHGFVHKRDALPVFCDALRAVNAGCLYFTPFATRLLDGSRGLGAPDGALTARERGVLQMVAEGMSNKQMATRLSISTKTVEHHRAHVMEKLDVHDVAGLTRVAIRRGLVPAD